MSKSSNNTSNGAAQLGECTMVQQTVEKTFPVASPPQYSSYHERLGWRLSGVSGVWIGAMGLRYQHSLLQSGQNISSLSQLSIMFVCALVFFASVASLTRASNHDRCQKCSMIASVAVAASHGRLAARGVLACVLQYFPEYLVLALTVVCAFEILESRIRARQDPTS